MEAGFKGLYIGEITLKWHSIIQWWWWWWWWWW